MPVDGMFSPPFGRNFPSKKRKLNTVPKFFDVMET
jgi:hypothetical protein